MKTLQRLGLAALPVVLMLVTGASQTVHGQHCLTPDGLTDAIHSFAVQLATDADSAWVAKRDRYQVPAVAASEVEVITASSTCRDAKDAYKAEMGYNGNRRVHVVRIGTRFLVMNPETTAGDYEQFIVFDDEWVALAVFAG
jgi:hypothetical protein